MRTFLARCLFPVLALCASASVEGQDCRSTDAGIFSTVRSLADRGDWDGMLRILDSACPLSSDVDYYRGIALAKLHRWPAARLALEGGRKKAPRDERFPVELAGVAFELRRYPEARSSLRQALRMDSRDPYAIDFLASLYFLDGNLEAALKYWNLLSKPKIEEIRLLPVPRLEPRLLDRALSFAPSSTLARRELEDTAAALRFLQVFPTVRFDLFPRPDGNFDLELRSTERSGWGGGKTQRVISVLREAPFGTLHCDLFNLRDGALNVQMFARLDPRKRRASASVSMPVRGNPKQRLHVFLDARDEQWDVSQSYRGTLSLPIFDLKAFKAAAEFEFLIGGRWTWKTGAAFSDRRFSDPSPLLNRPELFASGPALAYNMQLDGPLLELPEHRIELESTTRWQTGKVFSSGSPFAQAEQSLTWRRFLQSRGDDWQVNGSLTAAGTFGALPFDELFSLGQERDNETFLRGHNGIHKGRKGAGPLARNFVLWNSEINKTVFTRPFWGLKAAPFFDSAAAYDRTGTFGSGRTLWDAGLQLKLRVLQSRELILSCGWDLRSGKRALYLTVK